NITGTAPYVQLRFSQKAINAMKEKMMAGSVAKKGQKRPPRDFEDDYKQSMHISTEGWHGVPASSFRNAMISGCRLVGFQMTKAKLAVFIEADGIDAVDGIPLVKIEGTPEAVEHYVRNATGVVDIRVRAMWREWSIKLRVRFDADMFSLTDVANLLARVGLQVGIGEGRPDGKQSAGMGWGTFKVGGKA
ncbi:MAG: hypothetical protein IMZ71_05465, partial [Chloroflexi bacterium]|nr:hypothetical protein [Chloroflexota bacterium]